MKLIEKLEDIDINLVAERDQGNEETGRGRQPFDFVRGSNAGEKDGGKGCSDNQ